MKNFNALALLVMSLNTSILFAYDVKHGKNLYYEAKCQECHSESDYTGEERKVNNYERLQWRVERCDYTMNAGWFEEDIDDVVHYLNDSYYKFNTDKVVVK